jgi:hypothetical protein
VVTTATQTSPRLGSISREIPQEVTRLAKKSHSQPVLPLPFQDGVGWDECRFLQLGRASWRFKRESLYLDAVYRNHEQRKDYPLGQLSPLTPDVEILKWIAGHSDSITPADWIVIDDRIFAFTPDTGEA